MIHRVYHLFNFNKTDDTLFSFNKLQKVLFVGFTKPKCQGLSTFAHSLQLWMSSEIFNFYQYD